MTSIDFTQYKVDFDANAGGSEWSVQHLDCEQSPDFGFDHTVADVLAWIEAHHSDKHGGGDAAVPANITVNVHGSTMSERALLDAVQRATRWGR